MVPAAMTTRHDARRIALAAFLAFWVGACGAGSGTPSVTAGTPSSPPVGSTAPAPTATPLPTATAIPGYDGWSVINPGAVEITVDGPSLVLHLTGQALWFRDSQGVLFWTTTDGSFRMTAIVHTTRFSDPSKAPGQDGSVQLAGIMARIDTEMENYVFIVVGSDADGLSVETKSTKDSVSEYAGPAWASGDAELKLCRIGSTFTLAKRAVATAGAAGSSRPWTVAATLERTDLVGEIEVGPNIYTNGIPDLVARFDGLTIESIGPGEAC
jgi:hypothetical protein